MDDVISATQARVHFGELLRKVATGGGPVFVEKAGTPQAVVLSVEEYERLKKGAATSQRDVLAGLLELSDRVCEALDGSGVESPEELIRRITRYNIARIPTQTFKPTVDDRFSSDEVVSHSALSTAAQQVADSEELLEAVHDRTVVVGVDEGQFFDEGLVEVAERLAAAGKKVIVAGLDLDYLCRPFEPIPTLMTRAEYVTKSLAVCLRCGGAGMYTQRVIDSDQLVVIGAEGAYEARCRRCYDPTEVQQERLEIAEG